ncbi:MAG: cob(I)yrinic acid a,c-diamide adenosyltransferase [candidate division WOR-3 bacterium]
MIQVYTGNGKGKTTAAIGQAIRALGHNWKILMIQFMKGDEYGEIKVLKKLPNITVKQFGLKTFVKKGELKPDDIKLAREGWQLAKEAIESRKYDMIILDELNCALDYGLLTVKEVLTVLLSAPRDLEIIITGRYAPKELIEIADLVSEIKEIKHPLQKGVVNRSGIDY